MSFARTDFPFNGTVYTPAVSTIDANIINNYPGLILTPTEAGGEVQVVREINGSLWLLTNCDLNKATGLFVQSNPAFISAGLVLGSDGATYRVTMPAGMAIPWVPTVAGWRFSGGALLWSVDATGLATFNTFTAASLTALGNITSTAGNIVATVGSMSAGTTVTAGTGVTATTGNVVASAGNVTASGSMNAGTLVVAGTGVIASSGNVVATAGAVSAGTSVTAGTGIATTTGNITATAGVVVGGAGLQANTGNVTVVAGGVNAAGAFVTNRAPGTATIDSSASTVLVGIGGVVNFPNFSGLILVNNTGATGALTLFMCGGGNITTIANVGGVVGTLTFAGGQYVWTNTSGVAGTFAFMAFRTRTGA